MASSLLIVNFVCFLTLFIISGVKGVHIQFFGNWNFTGLVYESNSTAKCNYFPSYTTVHSVRTDTCLIAYNDFSCKWYFSEKFMPGEIHGLRSLGHIESFYICNETEGGSQLNVDITKFYNYWNRTHGGQLESYKNVCSCVNVPQYVQNMTNWSIDNHHNDLLAYYEPDCSENKWNSTVIVAGHNNGSRNMQFYKKTDTVANTTYQIQSFGPDPRSAYFQTSCTSSHVTTTESTKTIRSTAVSAVDFNADTNKCCEMLTNQIVELQAKQKEDFYKLMRIITQLVQQQVGNLTVQIKSDLHELFA